MSCPIPGESIFDTLDNRVNMIKYQKLCNEFGVTNGSDFRFKGGDNGGLGTMYVYIYLNIHCILVIGLLSTFSIIHPNTSSSNKPVVK